MAQAKLGIGNPVTVSCWSLVGTQVTSGRHTRHTDTHGTPVPAFATHAPKKQKSPPGQSLSNWHCVGHPSASSEESLNTLFAPETQLGGLTAGNGAGNRLSMSLTGVSFLWQAASVGML